MFKVNRVLGGALLALALLGSQTARADEEKAVSLIVKPRMGHVIRAKTIIKTNAMGMDVVVNQTQKDTVKEVKENGDVVTEVVDEGSTVNYGGTDHDSPAAMPLTITRDKFGKVKEYKNDNQGGFMTPEVANLMAVVSTFILTDKAVKTNDVWQTEIDNPAVKAKKITVKDTYLGLDKIDGKDYWKIKQTAEAVVDPDGSKMTYEITEWVNPADGQTVKVEGTVKDVPTQAGPLTMQISSKYAPADDKVKSEVEQAVNLMVKPKVGRTVRVKTVIKSSVMGMEILINSSHLDTIKEVKENGDVVTDVADEGTTVNIGGMDRDQPAAPPFTSTHDKFGKVKEFKKAEANPFMTPEIANLMESLTGFILTDKPVKVNDTWQTEIDNPVVKEKKITVKDTYLGLDKVDGKDYWKIKQTSEAIADADGNKVGYDVTKWVDPTTGETFKEEGTLKDLPTQAGPITMEMKSKVSKVDAKDKPTPKKAEAKP